MKIVFMQPLFCPTQEMFERNVRSLESLRDYLQKYPIKGQIDFLFSGWGDPVLFEKLTKLIHTFLPATPVTFRDRNYGKAIVVNDCLKDYFEKNNADFIFTCDSDIVFDLSEQDIFSVAIDVMSHEVTTHMGSRRRLGVIAYNQKEAQCHIHNAFDCCAIINNKHCIKWARTGEGIAGGCVCISVPLWKQINGYRPFGVYAGDDGYLMYDCIRVGYLAAVLQTSYVIHPKESNQTYQQWKNQTIKQSGHVSYEELFNEATTFWKGLTNGT